MMTNNDRLAARNALHPLLLLVAERYHCSPFDVLDLLRDDLLTVYDAASDLATTDEVELPY